MEGLGGFACFSGFPFPWFACDGGTAGIAGVAGLGAGGFADRAGTAGVARSGVCAPFVGLGVDGSGALAAAGTEEVPVLVPPFDVGCSGAGVLGVGAGTGGAGVPAPPDDGPATGPRTGAAAGPLVTKIGVNPENGEGAADFLTACGRASETSTGTLRACVLGMESSRAAERSSTVKACSQSCAEATVPAATAPT